MVNLGRSVAGQDERLSPRLLPPNTWTPIIPLGRPQTALFDQPIAAVRDRRLGSFTHCGIFESGRSACNLAHVADRNPAMTPCTEFCFSRRIQRATAYKVHRSVGQKIASGGGGAQRPI